MNDSKVVEEVVDALDAKATQLQEGLDAKFREFEQNNLTKMTGTHYSAPTSPGILVTKSERLGQLRDGQKTTGRISLDGLNVKSLTSLQGSTESPQAGIDVVPSEVGGLFGIGRRNLSLLDLIPRV